MPFIPISVRRRVHVTVILCAAFLGLPLSAQRAVTALRSIPELSGHWVLEKVVFSRASDKWRSGTPVESINIIHTAEELRFEGPRGLYEGTAPMETYKLNGSKFTYVQNFGDWWRKSQTWVEWDGPTLVLRLRTRAGWYSAGSPDKEELMRPHGDVFRRVTREKDTLTVRTEVLSDDDPPDRENQTSTQIFERSR